VNVRPVSFAINRDNRGTLTAIEVEQDIPFVVRRVFFVHDVAPDTVRGGHAHRFTDQILIGLGGAVTVRVTDGQTDESFCLDNPGSGIFVGRMNWTVLQHFTLGSVLLVLASDSYDRSQSIRTWDEYLAAKAND
jgi:dTDP-4-dehydrorhamnose 3,5-epimerase-like enzyme